jgi:hypothetical protein
MRSLLRKLGAVLAGLLAATLVAELGFAVILATPLRWVLPAPEIPMYGPDDYTGYRQRAHVSGLWTTENRTLITTSNLGLRDRDRPLAPGDGPRAIVVGDSFIEAAQVDERQTAVAVAERRLERRIPHAEVVNLGLGNARLAQLDARLQSQGLALAPDVAVVVLSIQRPLMDVTDAGALPAYRPGADGELQLSYDFRASFGHRFRTSAAGQVFYWLLDHSNVMRVLNDRKNVGLTDRKVDYRRRRSDEPPWSCDGRELDQQTALWAGGTPPSARAQLDAFVRDLAQTGRAHRLPIVVAVRGLEARCTDLAARRSTLVGAIRTKLEDAGLQFADLDAEVLARVGQDGVAPLFGFSAASLGYGHLNVAGNRVYGEILADIIAAALPRR